MRYVIFPGLLGLVALCACVEVPELNKAISDDARDAPYPQLIPVEKVRAEVPGNRITPETGKTLDQRADALRRRADALRKPVIDASSRRRMERGVSR